MQYANRISTIVYVIFYKNIFICLCNHFLIFKTYHCNCHINNKLKNKKKQNVFEIISWDAKKLEVVNAYVFVSCKNLMSFNPFTKFSWEDTSIQEPHRYNQNRSFPLWCRNKAPFSSIHGISAERTKSDARTICPKIVSITLFVLLSFINMFFTKETPGNDRQRTTFLSRNSFQDDPKRASFCSIWSEIKAHKCYAFVSSQICVFIHFISKGWFSFR